MCYIGIILAKFGIENYAHNMAQKEAVNKAYWAVSYTLIAMPLSMTLYQRILFGGKIKEKLEAFYTNKITPLESKRDKAQIFFWSLLTILSFFAVVYSYLVLPKPPLFAILSGASSSEILYYRDIAQFHFPGNIYIKNLLMLNLVPFLSYIAYAYKKLYNNDSLVKGWFYLTFILALLTVTFYGDKAPLVKYIVTLFLLKGILDRGYSKKTIIVVGIIAAFLIILLYVLIDKGIQFSLYGGVISRLLMVPSAGLMLTFDIFPDSHGFLNGASFPGWMVSSFGLEHARSALVVMEEINPTGVHEGSAGVINSLYIAEAYANFGMYGLILAPFIVGFVIQLIYSVLVSAPKTPLFVGLMGFFFLDFPILGGFVDFIWNVSWIYIAFLALASIYFRKIFDA